MRRFNSKPCLTAALAFCCGLACQQAIAQDLILLNQDGEEVGVAKDVDDEKVVGAPAAVAVAEPAEGKESATLDNGIIRVVGPDGEVQELKMSDARSVTITRSSKTVTGEDGQPRTETRGKAILIGPDGVRREIHLNEAGNVGKLVEEIEVPKSWMIGARCEAVSPILRSQLQLEEGTGLAVRRALGGGAAEVAGIKSNDIILYADQKPIVTQKQLNKVVNEAGAEGRAISFIVLRAGEEVSLSVTPVEREGLAAMPGFGVDFNDDLNLGAALEIPGIEFRQIGPGIILGGRDVGGDLHRDMMEKMQQRMQRIQEEVEAMRGGIEIP